MHARRLSVPFGEPSARTPARASQTGAAPSWAPGSSVGRRGAQTVSRARRATDDVPCLSVESGPKGGEVRAAAVVAEILKREGVDFLIGYPVNPIIEAAAEADIRTIIVRQERTGLHMADAVSRVTSGERIGVFRDAAWTRGGELVRRRRPGLRRLRPDRGAARRVSAAAAQHPAELQLAAQLPAHHQVGGTGDPGRGGARRHAPRVRAGPQRPPAPGPGRAALRSSPRGSAGRLDLRARAATALGAGSSRCRPKSRRRWSRPSGR